MFDTFIAPSLWLRSCFDCLIPSENAPLNLRI